MQLYTKTLLGMALGVVLGFFVGPNSALLPDTGVALSPGALVVAEQGQTRRVPLCV
jgi:hypothetical protein